MLDRYDYARIKDEILQALAAMCINDIPDSKWYADNEANAHISSSIGNLSSSFPFSWIDKIFIGDSAAFQLYVGNTVLSSTPLSPVNLQNVLVVIS